MFWDILIFSAAFLGFYFCGGELSMLNLIVAILVDLGLIYLIYKLIGLPTEDSDEKK